MDQPGNPAQPHGKKKLPPHLSYRSRHRAASHDAAHDVEHSHGDLPDHPLVPRGQAPLITDNDALAELLADLRAAGRFAYDSEFIGELSYHPQLCLIQVATKDRVALIDPMADVDLRPYWELLADPSIEKLVHAGAQDVEPVHRHVSKACANLFDTQIAAGFCAMAYPVALSKLVGEVLKYRMPKGLTFTDWQRRPLSPSQLRYAADDVRFLPALSAELKARLHGFSNHARWVTQECNDMCDPAEYAFDPDTDYLHVRGAGTLSVPQLAVLRELMIWREACAIDADCPPRAFLKDEALIDLSRHPAKSVEKLYNVKFLPRPVVEAQGREIVERTARALANPPAHIHRLPHVEPTPTERFRTESLWAAAQAICLSQGIDPAVVTSRQEIGELDRAWHGDDRELVEQIQIMKGWRREALGERLTRMLRGEHEMTLKWKDQRLG